MVTGVSVCVPGRGEVRIQGNRSLCLCTWEGKVRIQGNRSLCLCTWEGKVRIQGNRSLCLCTWDLGGGGENTG